VQCKDIPELPILRFLAGPYDGWATPGCGTWFNHDPIPQNCVLRAMPEGVPEKLALAKMRQMIRKRVIDGCGCGCRGDFRLNEKSRAILVATK